MSEPKHYTLGRGRLYFDTNPGERRFLPLEDFSAPQYEIHLNAGKTEGVFRPLRASFSFDLETDGVEFGREYSSRYFEEDLAMALYSSRTLQWNTERFLSGLAKSGPLREKAALTSFWTATSRHRGDRRDGWRRFIGLITATSFQRDSFTTCISRPKHTTALTTSLPWVKHNHGDYQWETGREKPAPMDFSWMEERTLAYYRAMGESIQAAAAAGFDKMRYTYAKMSEIYTGIAATQELARRAELYQRKIAINQMLGRPYNGEKK